MPISVTCTCGKAYKFKDIAAGQRAKCVHCGGVVVIPDKPDPVAPKAAHPPAAKAPAAPAASARVSAAPAPAAKAPVAPAAKAPPAPAPAPAAATPAAPSSGSRKVLVIAGVGLALVLGITAIGGVVLVWRHVFSTPAPLASTQPPAATGAPAGPAPTAMQPAAAATASVTPPASSNPSVPATALPVSAPSAAPGGILFSPVAAPPASAAAQAVGAPNATTEKILKKVATAKAHFFAFPASGAPEESAKRAAALEAAQVAEMGPWADWLRGRPGDVPSFAQFRVPIYKEQFMMQLAERPAGEEKGDFPLMIEGVPQPRRVPVTWLLYPGLGFAVDESGIVIAMRVTSPLPPAAAPKP